MHVLRALFSKCYAYALCVLHAVLLGEGKDAEIQAASRVAHHVLEGGKAAPQE